VKFNGTATTGSITTDQQITATIPANATSGLITVTSSAGTGSSPVNFYFPPGVTNFSPSAGRVGTNVVIKGTNFLNASKVLFGSLVASFVTNSLTQITAVVPPNAVSAPIRVIAPGGQYITTGNFIVQPDISSISPISGNVNTTVTINGSNLSVGSPTYPIVRFNGVLASLIGASSSVIQVFAPAGANAGPITVQTSEGTATSPTNFYYPPFIGGFSPTNGAAGATITISGQNLTNASAVSFNGNNAASFTAVNNTTVTAVVTTPGGTVASPQSFFGIPVISSFSPQAGVPGVPVTITGTNLSFETHVLFNGVTATTASNVSPTVVMANVPVGATSGHITVQTIGGNVTSTGNFTVDPLLLAISNIGSNTVAISWTTNAPGYFLESTMSLLASNNLWSNEPIAAQIIGGKVTVTNALTNAQKYYRLRN
jgi:hypothetical protein